MILVMPENESFQFQSGYFSKIEIEKWEIYKQFTEYTIKELSSGDLDEWIDNLHNPEYIPKPQNTH